MLPRRLIPEQHCDPGGSISTANSLYPLSQIPISVTGHQDDQRWGVGLWRIPLLRAHASLVTSRAHSGTTLPPALEIGARRFPTCQSTSHT